MSEKRQFTRYLFPLDVTLHLAENTVQSAHSHNISKGGMCLLLDQPVDPEQEGSVSFVFSRDDITLQFSSRFRVRWYVNNYNATYSIGIQFVDIEPAGLERLEKIIENLDILY